MSRPMLLDLFCGAGGAAVGYHQAGFDVIGVDIKPQPRYPFTFVEMDALAFLDQAYLEPYAAIHASPICQTWTRATAWRGSREDHPDLLTPTLHLLEQVSIPWIVENVPEAAWYGPLRADLELCGTQFGLRVQRHRVFQLGNWSTFPLMPPCHHHGGLLPFMHKGERAYADAMGCDWMTKFEARQAIPPAYARFVGEQLMAHLDAGVEVA